MPEVENAETSNESMMQNREHAEKQIAKIELAPEYTVLDVGAGTRRLAIPIAKCVNSVTDINAGDIDSTTVPLVDWRFMDADTIRVLFKLSGDNGVSGSGYVTKIGFEITGSPGDTSVLDISDGMLSDTEADEIPATWTDYEATV